jgi:thiol-disulfide isomerase/thioredoxin
MGRLSTVTLAAATLVAVAACDKGSTPAPPPPGAQRSEAVRATAPTAPAMPTVGAQTAAHAAVAAPRRLCEGQLDRPGRSLPTRALSHAQAPGAPVLGDALPSSGGRWTWVNFWAAWCGPCKEEMPRLRAWEQRLAKSMQVAFVSLDDDERQLAQFLGGQPPSGVRTSFWLPDGAARDAWMAGLRLQNPPELPAHALVDPSGQLRCVIHGAVEDADFAQVAAIVAKR